MDFSLSPEQIALQDSVRRTLRDHCPLDRVRLHAQGDTGIASDIWRSLRELGVPAILIPEEFGGLNLTLLDAALVSECLGAAAAPTDFLGHALATLAFREAGSPAQKHRHLRALAAGTARAAAALTEAVSGARDAAGLRYDSGTISGTSLFTIGAIAPDVLVAATPNGALYALDDAMPSVAAMQTIDRTAAFGELRAARTPAEPLPGSNVLPPPQALSRMRDAAWILLAADMLGASQTMLDLAVAYAKQREQFGRAIGSFQAVKHLCADMAAKLEPCRALVWYAAHAFDERLEEAPLAAAHAKAHLSEVSRFVARTATEVHGGMGFTDLLGLHYWFKRVGVARQILGGPEQVRRHAAALPA